MPKFKLTNDTTQKAIINIFQEICWIIDPGLEGNIGYLFDCIHEHSFKVISDEAGRMQFYILYYERHNPNSNYKIQQLTAKTYTDQQFIESMISILLSDKSLSVNSHINNFELYITRTNHDHFHVSIYPALEVFNVEDIDGVAGYKEWQTVLSRLKRPTL